MIRIALDIYSADRIAKFDFALANSGGAVVGSSDTYPPALETYRVMGLPLWSVPSSPKVIIQVSFVTTVQVDIHVCHAHDAHILMKCDQL